MDRLNPFSGDPRQSARDRELALRRQPLRQSWPVLVMLPALQGIVYAASWSLLFAMFLGKAFGLSQGRDYPWPGAVAIMYLVSFWINRLIAWRFPPGAQAQVLSVVGWFLTLLAWIALEPAYHGARIWTHPGELVSSEAYLIPLILISMGVWWLGVSYASEVASIAPEDERFVVQRAWFVMFFSLLLAMAIGGEIGDQAVSIARLDVPILLIASLSLVAGAEVESTRRLAARRGGQAPGWSRWVRLVAGFVIGVTVLTVIVLLVFSPEFFASIVHALEWAARWVGFVLGYVLYAVVWSLFQIFNAIASLLHALFGDLFGPVKIPDQPSMPRQQPIRPPETGETGPWKYAMFARWGVLGVVVAVGLLVLFRFTRRSTAEAVDDGLNEQRESVFSADLAKQQLRDLFRRRSRAPRPPVLDLGRAPGTVREAMVYLQTLALRQRVARREGETANDFSARLRAVWPGLGQPLMDIGRAYQEVRYGERDDPPSPEAIRDVQARWSDIWKRRKDWVPPDEPDDQRTG